MSRVRFPLGLDLGTQRMRIASLAPGSDGPVVHAVAVREMPTEDPDERRRESVVATMLEDAVEELGTRERRCIAAVPVGDAIVHALRLPRMAREERRRAAAFEAHRISPYGDEEQTIAVREIDNVCALGIAKTAPLTFLQRAICAAKLRPAAIDYTSFALARVFRDYDAALDVGTDTSALHVFTTLVPTVLAAPIGSATVTAAIAQELRLDEASAERRKRIVGTAGAGEGAAANLATEIAAKVFAARRQGARIERIAATGNGSRLPNLLSHISDLTNARVEYVLPAALAHSEYPAETGIASICDWSLAIGLALWPLA